MPLRYLVKLQLGKERGLTALFLIQTEEVGTKPKSLGIMPCAVAFLGSSWDLAERELISVPFRARLEHAQHNISGQPDGVVVTSVQISSAVHLNRHEISFHSKNVRR